LAVSGLAAAGIIVFIVIVSLGIRRAEADLMLTNPASDWAARARFTSSMHARSPGPATWELGRCQPDLPTPSDLAATPGRLTEA
jgi:hypothetical protein